MSKYLALLSGVAVFNLPNPTQTHRQFETENGMTGAILLFG